MKKSILKTLDPVTLDLLSVSKKFNSCGKSHFYLTIIFLGPCLSEKVYRTDTLGGITLLLHSRCGCIRDLMYQMVAVGHINQLMADFECWVPTVDFSLNPGWRWPVVVWGIELFGRQRWCVFCTENSSPWRKQLSLPARWWVHFQWRTSVEFYHCHYQFWSGLPAYKSCIMAPNVAKVW